MAESESTRQQAGGPGTPPAAPPGASPTGERRAPGQETGQESHQLGPALTAQGTDRATEVAAQGRESLRTWQTQLEQHVREQPLQSLLMAAGIGLLVGLLRRR